MLASNLGSSVFFHPCGVTNGGDVSTLLSLEERNRRTARLGRRLCFAVAMDLIGRGGEGGGRAVAVCRKPRRAAIQGML